MPETGLADGVEVDPRRIKIRGVRQVIAQQMARSHAEIPGVHVVEEVDVTGVSLSAIVAVTAASIASLVESYAYFNAHVVGDEVLCFRACNVAIAVDTPRGLMVPVIHDCQNLEVEEIQAEIGRLADLARAGRLTGRDVTGATVTLTSPGRRGGILATPLINPPQTTIIGIHRAVARVVPADDGALAIRSIANLTVTFDHRVIDGALAGDYAIELGQRITGHGAAAPPASQ
ncbi:2-oxo acid dehydrogenase subunit E2 [Nocardioides sp.]|uniref:2-oxo acid dehydrogenase subunit E2 n=1 Tax=Nocardioides sp. TaxID=35761 RepID=UPI003D135B92